MKITIDDIAKTIKVEGTFKLDELIKFMTKHNFDVDEYSINAETIVNWYPYQGPTYSITAIS